MMTEYGIFNDDGLVERGFVDFDEAQEQLDSEYDEEDNCHVGELCPEHDDQERGHCEECGEDEADEDDDLGEGDEPDFESEEEDE